MAALKLDDRGILITCPACGQQNRLVYTRLGDPVRCGRCKNELAAPTEPMDVTSTADFDRLVTNAAIPVVVDYWAPWCGPCRMVAPELAKVAARNSGRLIIVKVNTDQLTDLGQRYAVRSIPMLAVFVGGREVTRAAGARPASDIESLVMQAIEKLHDSSRTTPEGEGRLREDSARRPGR